MLKSPGISGFLLCAGEGSRFEPHTRFVPKPLLPFLNLPLLAYNIYLLRILGVKRLSANVHAHPELLKTQLKKWARKGEMDSLFLSHEKNLLGSAGGLLKLKNFFKGSKPFFYLNGDSFMLWRKENIKKSGGFKTQSSLEGPLLEGNTLKNFYLSHISTGALASFLVRPRELLNPTRDHLLNQTRSRKRGFIWANRETGEVYSFFHPKEKNHLIKPYDFSGLALFSPKIFKEIKPGALHIFKDVLESKPLKKHCRVYPLSSLKLLDMNQLDTYLKGTGEMLSLLKRERGEKSGGHGSFLRSVLSFYSPAWNFFEGENYFSATALENPRAFEKKNILFCGTKVKGLEKLSVKGFSVLGDFSSLHCPSVSFRGEKKTSGFLNPLQLSEKKLFQKIIMEKSVLGEGLSLKTHLKNSLVLK